MNRKELLKKLIDIDSYSDSLVSKIQIYGFDSDPIVVLDSFFVIKALKLYLEKRVSFEQIVSWANFFESRDDVNFENESVKYAIFRMANPELFSKFDAASAMEIIDQL